MPDVQLTVFDDRSTDKETCSILEWLRQDGRTKILTTGVFSGTSRFGNSANGCLYENIQSFVDTHARCSYALFLQDDTQIVRTFTPNDRATIDQIFSKYQQAAFIYPVFLTSRSYYVNYIDSASLKANGPSFSFLYDYDFSGYFDVCIANMDRLRDAKWQFGNELTTSIAAREKFGTMRLMRQPFVAHLPSPPTYRHRGQTWTQRIWERYRAGLYPIDSLSESDLQRLNSMNDAFPTADSFLTSESFWGSHPWPYARLEGASFLIRALDRIEIRLRGWLRS